MSFWTIVIAIVLALLIWKILNPLIVFIFFIVIAICAFILAIIGTGYDKLKMIFKSFRFWRGE